MRYRSGHQIVFIDLGMLASLAVKVCVCVCVCVTTIKLKEARGHEFEKVKVGHMEGAGMRKGKRKIM